MDHHVEAGLVRVLGGASPACRIDPYYEGLGAGARQYFWFESHTWRQQFGRRDWYGWSVPSQEVAWERVCSRLLLSCSILAVVSSYRTVTVQQLAVFVGRSADEAFVSHVMCLFSVGLLDVGHFVGAREGDPLWTVAVCRGRRKEPWRRFRLGLTDELRWALTLGSSLSRGLQHERHNVITSEILLRACQFLDGVVTVGEAHAFLNPLLGVEGGGSVRGDGVLLFEHGGAVVLETCGSVVSMDVEKKVRQWGDGLHASRLGCVPFVVFVCAVSGDEDYVSVLKRSVASALSRLYPGQYFASSVWDRIGVVSYERWFTEGKMPTEDFLGLCVERFNVASGVWQEVCVRDVLPASGEPLPLYRAACSSLVTPLWTRRLPYPLWAVKAPEPWWESPRVGVSGGVWFEPWRVGVSCRT